MIEGLFSQILSFQELNHLKFILILSLFNFIYFLTPLPTTFIVIFNGFIFGTNGFIYSIFFTLFGSFLIFEFAKNLSKKKIFNQKFFKFYKKKIQTIKFIKTPNNGIIFLSRYIIPYFVHNIMFGFLETKLRRFMLIILLAEIPLILSFNNIGKSLNNFVLLKDYKISDLFLDYEFLLSFLFVFSIILIASSVEKRIIKKNN